MCLMRISPKEPHDAQFYLSMIKENKISQNLIGKINNLRNIKVNYYWLLLMDERVILILPLIKSNGTIKILNNSIKFMDFSTA